MKRRAGQTENRKRLKQAEAALADAKAKYLKSGETDDLTEVHVALEKCAAILDLIKEHAE